MGKYQGALDNIGMTVIDSLSDGYNAPKYVKDFCYGDYQKLQELVDKATVLRPINEWDEDYGACLWWNLPIEGPPYCGSPIYDDFPSYVTHFTQLVNLDWRYEDER